MARQWHGDLDRLDCRPRLAGVSYRVCGEPVEEPRRGVERALQAWSGFPAARQPRPLVLLGPVVHPRGFPDGEKKLAVIHGAIEAAPGFPAEVLDAMRPHRQAHDGPPLLAATAELGTAEFVTDRGRCGLPAWNVRIEGVPEPVLVLDPAVSKQAWRPPGMHEHDDIFSWGSTATVSADGRAVTLSFTGSPRAYTDYPRADVLEAGAAVALLPVAVDIGPPGARRAYAETREVTAALTRPLGPRVLLDGKGAPVAVQA